MTARGPAGVFVHATALVVGEAGLLLRGPSNSGKTSLALALIAGGARDGRFARLVGDDRVELAVANGRLLARPHPAVAGRVEVRGLGLLGADWEPACVVRLVVDLAVERAGLAPRCPDHPPTVALLGLTLPALTLPAADGAASNAGRIFTIMDALRQKQGGTGPICLPTWLQCTR